MDTHTYVVEQRVLIDPVQIAMHTEDITLFPEDYNLSAEDRSKLHPTWITVGRAEVSYPDAAFTEVLEDPDTGEVREGVGAGIYRTYETGRDSYTRITEKVIRAKRTLHMIDVPPEPQPVESAPSADARPEVL